MSLRLYEGGPTDGDRVIRLLTSLSRPSVGPGGLVIGKLKDVQPFVDSGQAEFWPKEGGRAPATYAAAVAPYKDPIGDFAAVRAELRAAQAEQDESEAAERERKEKEDSGDDSGGSDDGGKAKQPAKKPPAKKSGAKKPPAKK